MSLDSAASELFRQTMSKVVGPVTVVTTLEGEVPHGTTVSAFISLSLDPPMVLVSLDKRSKLLSTLKRTGRFGVNILRADQADAASTFARKNDNKFLGVAWHADHGSPRIVGAHAWVSCDVAELIEAGDHEVVIGAVRTADHSDSEPLTYYSRSFGTHVSHALAYSAQAVAS